MWVLDTEGDAFQGKILWLRPGKKFLFGRTQSDAGQFVISDKTISRKHLTVEVSAVGPADCSKAKTRSKIILEDLDTKIGTLVNGVQIRNKKHELDKDHNVVTLGKYKHHFTFTWIPVTFTFSFTTKEAKADPYTDLYKLLGPLDIKVLVNYERGYTTHVVAKKRNTSKGLQALIDGKYIVHNDSFIKAVVTAATVVPATEEGGVAQSPLEQDWAENFPHPLRFLPPRGDEPTQRDSIAYAPNLSRLDLFDGYTFIFYETRQFENLLAPITEGRGKALFRDIVPGRTEVNDFVRYVKGIAGEKGLGEFEDGSEGKGVVVVRFNPVKGVGSEWYTDFNKQVSLYLDHRLIEQNEFLDAILGNDASVLRRPLELEQSGPVAPSSTANTVGNSQTLRKSHAVPNQAQAQVDPTEPVSQPARRGRSRRTVAPRFKGFDSDEDTPPTINPVPESMEVEHVPVAESQSQNLFITQDPDMIIGTGPSQEAESQTKSSRKRSSPPMDYGLEEEEDIMEQMAPAATAIKRRRLADDAARRRRGVSSPPPSATKEERVEEIQPNKKARKEIDVIEIARVQREKAEELARAEREALQEELDGMDIEAIRNLAIVEEMEVTRRERPVCPARADESDRWDDRWNGRKNFKKFRRRGAENGRRELGRVIVPLEQAKKKEYGIGDDYWLDGDSHSRKKKEKGKNRGTQDLSQTETQPSRSENRASTRAAEILAREAEVLLDNDVRANGPLSSDVEIVDPPPKPAAPRSQKTQEMPNKTSASQILSPKRKRVASTTLSKPAPAKKAKAATIPVQDSDDSDDELKFRFRRRK